MMVEFEAEYYPLAGQPVTAGELRLPKARELVLALQGPGLPYARLVACVRQADDELVVLDVEPEVPQDAAHDVRYVERVAVGFAPADEEHPLVLALRRDFPLVPHLHFGLSGQPRRLCLYQSAYADLKPTWTAAGLLAQLQRWLSQTARGELHAPDQALEQAFYAPRERLVLPAAYFDPAATLPAGPLTVRLAGQVRGYATLVATHGQSAGPAVQFVTFTYLATPQAHGLIQEQPRTLAALQQYLDPTSADFTAALRQHLLHAQQQPDFAAGQRLLVVLRLPRQRTAAGPVEAMEVWAFATTTTVAEVGEDLGLWVRHDNALARLLRPDLACTGADSPLALLGVLPALSRQLAAAYNGLAPTRTRYVAIGAGSLGSQVVNNLVRGGQGQWSWLDEDVFLPHNAARHYLPGYAVGQAKALAMAALLTATYTDAHVQGLVADALQPLPAAAAEAYAAAEVVLDLSASVAVARQLALDAASPGRRLSLFLNPSGTDLVLLAEPADRSLRLDQLEMAYYRALLRDPALHGHLLAGGQPIRYAHACRDVSVQLPQELVGLHAAIGSRAVRTAVAAPSASLKLWRAQPDLSVTAHELPVSPSAELVVGDWTVSVAQELLHELAAQRQARLPNETGGVLVGVFDTQRRRVYLVDHLPSPPDSQEWPTAYYRGVAGVPEALEDISRRTGRQVSYAGEWHAHPPGYPVHPSPDDQVLFAWLQQERRADGLPALMAIVGDDGTTGWYVADLGAGGYELRLPARGVA